MTLVQLKYLLAVAKYQNFTLASKNCFVTQPTLSMQIQKLEIELDIMIFNRKKNPIELTKIGEKIIQQAKIILDESQRIKDIVAHQKGYIGGDLKLGIIPTITPTLLPLFLKTFLKKHPKVNLIIEELTTQNIIKKLKNGTIDAAIAATPLENDSFIEKVLYYEPFIGFVSKEHRLYQQKNITVNDLDINDILLLEDGHCFKDSVLNLCKSIATNSKSFKVTSGSFNTLINLTKEGLGMTLLPYLQSLELNEADKQHIRPFTKPVPAREVSLILHKTQLKLHLINALKSTIDLVIKGVIAFSDVEIVSPLHGK